MDDPLVIFVAMPGTDMGAAAAWRDIPEIKKHLYDPVAELLRTRFGVEVQLRIEKDKTSQGGIHRSMFNEALNAPVYIADLTGANANVYLELGARWALRDYVTVLVCQEVRNDVKFNVAANRVIPYGGGPSELERARAHIAEAIIEGLAQRHVDSPIREGLDLITVRRRTVEELEGEIDRLRAERGDELVGAARNAPHEEKVALLRRAIETNPAHVEAYLALGEALSAAGDHSAALAPLQRVVKLAPSLVDGWRELGIAQSRNGDLDDAAGSIERAIELSPDDSEAYSTLGGIYRRKARAMFDDSAEHDWDTLRKARDAYAAQADKTDRRDSYPLLNVARLDLLLARADVAAQQAAFESFQTLEDLARYTARTEGSRDPWKWLDLADALAFNGKVAEAVQVVDQGMAAFDPAQLAATARSALDPLRDLLAAGYLTEPTETAVKALISEYEKYL